MGEVHERVRTLPRESMSMPMEVRGVVMRSLEMESDSSSDAAKCGAGFMRTGANRRREWNLRGLEQREVFSRCPSQARVERKVIAMQLLKWRFCADSARDSDHGQSTCEFECGAGFMRTGSDITVGGGGTCVALGKGKFFPDAPARQSGTESDCDAAPLNGDFVPTQLEAVATACL